MPAVPQIVLTECSPATVMDPTTLSQPTHRQNSSFERSQRKFSPEELPEKEEKQLVLLVTDAEIRVLAPVEVEELRQTFEGGLGTLKISSETSEMPCQEILSEQPILVVFQKERTAKDAYRRLHRLLVSMRPAAKPRMKFQHYTGKLERLVDALLTGSESGDRLLKLQSSNSSSASVEEQKPAKQNVCRSTYKRLDSLEETIRELENTLIEIGGHSTVDQLYSGSTASPDLGQASASETKKPPVPPKPTSFKRASIQVHTTKACCV